MGEVIMNLICLGVWIYWLIDGIIKCNKGREVSKAAYFCAVIIVIIEFIGRLFGV